MKTPRTVTKIKMALVATNIVAPAASHAVVIDRLHCDISLQDLTSGAIASESQTIGIVRMPLNTSPSPDIRMTGGLGSFNLKIKDGRRSIDVSLNPTYQHAIKYDSNGKPIAARQGGICWNLSYNFCTESSSPGQPNSCVPLSSSCISEPPGSTPFDPVNGWDPVPFISENVPAFRVNSGAVQHFGFERDPNGNPLYEFYATCKYEGTDI